MSNPSLGQRNTTNSSVIQWVEEAVARCKPANVFWCSGSPAEKEALTASAVSDGVLIQLNQENLPGCYYHRSHGDDVARVEQCTYICAETQVEAGPNNNWAPPQMMYEKLHHLLRGSMRGRTLYVVPYVMGPVGSPLARVGIELTDSIYVALSMGIMTRMGDIAYQQLGDSNHFNRGLHCMLGLNPEQRYICHFPQDNTIISVGSNYGGNVLLGKKCLSLRLGSHYARKEGWMAEHMLLLCVESPAGDKTYVAAAFPSACGKTNLAMLIPPPRYEGWKVSTIGDDIAWMYAGSDGRLYAVNPEAGYFGVVPGTNRKSNPNAMEIISRDTIYTNVALLPDGDVWWEGKDGPVPEECLDWQGRPWNPRLGTKAAHPNSRFAAPMANNPALAAEVNWPEGVPISAIVFGGRRSSTIPLIFQAFNWTHGVYLGATMGSETTAAAAGEVGQVRRDPMAMLPFCGYDMGDYFSHWLNMRKRITKPPRIFHVNWFRKDEHGGYIWPGFGENMRIIRWIVDRCRGRIGADESALGWLPAVEDFDLDGLDNVTPEQFMAMQKIDPQEWKREILLHDELFMNLRATLPKELIFQRELLVSRI